MEIGCGTGSLLFRIAPQCQAYWGVDFSRRALSYVERQAADFGLTGVTLLERSADQLADVPDESFDTVILNSVVQYFPNVEYLVNVLREAARLTRPGGVVFVGDVRSLELLEAFHASVQLHRAAASLPCRALRRGVREQLTKEQELAVSPALFRDLGRDLPRVRRGDVRVKRGRSRNELSGFRYDELLHVGQRTDEAGAPPVLNWTEEGFTLAALRRYLAEKAPDALVVTRVPNARRHRYRSATAEAGRLPRTGNGRRAAAGGSCGAPGCRRRAGRCLGVDGRAALRR